MPTHILNYGGGTQTLAMIVLVKRGILPRPDYVIAADTGREVKTTWEYADAYARPLLASIGLDLHIASHDLATVDLYPLSGDAYPLLPAFHETGRLSAYCSIEWKARVVGRYARTALGVSKRVHWVGYAADEKHRYNGKIKPATFGEWQTYTSTEGDRVYPLVGLMLTSEDCKHIIESEGLPIPKKTRCKMCPHQTNEQWREVRDDADEWAEAIAIDEELRTNNDRPIYLHSSRKPLRDADLNEDDGREPSRQCGLGICFV